MNATLYQYYDSPQFECRSEFRQENGPAFRRATNRPKYSRRRGKHPLQVNGIHRRRRKKILW